MIVDEIHALCPNKRGVFLALLLERLEAINPAGFVRIGLSATQRPLEEVARYLGGLAEGRGATGRARFEPRPVTIVDAGRRKELDLEVIAPFGRAGPPRRGLDLAGDRAPAARPDPRAPLDDRLRQQPPGRRAADGPPERAGRATEAEDEPAEPPVVARSHHGSLSLEERRATEEALKRGELPAVVATASLELGIDMGAVDLVCQVESPGSVARGLQRVGRAGHVVGRVSKGRLIAKTPSDLLESAALCPGDARRRGRDAPGADQLPRRPGPAGRRLRGGGPLGRARRCSTWSAGPTPIAT